MSETFISQIKSIEPHPVTVVTGNPTHKSHDRPIHSIRSLSGYVPHTLVIRQLGKLEFAPLLTFAGIGIKIAQQS